MTAHGPRAFTLLAVGLWLLATTGLAACGGGEAERERRSNYWGSYDESGHDRQAADDWDGSDSDTPPLSAAEQRVIDRLALAAEQVRELEFASPVDVSVQDRAEIVAFVSSQIDEDELREARDVYVSLGLLPEDVDVLDLIQRVLGEQIAGYYDPESQRLVIRDQVMRGLGRGGSGEEIAQARITIVHELVHALQDQRLGLGALFARMKDDDDIDSDTAAAAKSLIEGDATLAMLAFAAVEQGGDIRAITAQPDALAQMIRESAPVTGQELSSAPAIFRVTLMSEYADGLVFAAHLHRAGGYRAVDDALRRPPVSTEQVLHPERYLRGELPDALSVPELPGLEAAGLTMLHEDTLGELELRVYFGQLTDDVDVAAADGWSGDRLRVYRQGDTDEIAASVWFTSWDDEAEAREAEAAATRIRDAIAAETRGKHLVLRRGRALLIVRHVPAALHREIVVAFEQAAQSLPRQGRPARRRR